MAVTIGHSLSSDQVPIFSISLSRGQVPKGFNLSLSVETWSKLSISLNFGTWSQLSESAYSSTGSGRLRVQDDRFAAIWTGGEDHALRLEAHHFSGREVDGPAATVARDEAYWT